MNSIQLKPGRERPLRRRHPWIFSGAIQTVRGDPGLGEIVEVVSSSGEWLAFAAYSPVSQIRARVLGWDRDVHVGADLIRKRILAAIKARESLQNAYPSNAWREVFSESDGLPGLIIDRYDDVRVVQLHTAWAETIRDLLVDVLVDQPGSRLIYERSDLDVRQLEGLEPRTEALFGEDGGQVVEIYEGKLRYFVDYHAGHKTGFYLDQKENRAWLEQLDPGPEVLDAFSYTGAFSMVSLAAGAEHVTAIDSSGPALETAESNLRLNGYETDRFTPVEDDVFSALRGLRDRGEAFNTIFLDPPKFAATTSQVGRASRAYKDINLLALKLLRPGGFLATFSCSGGVSAELFQKIVADAALDAGVQASIVHWFHQGADHPVGLAFPESQYLKGFLLQVS
jgi:23S rRNA (cytosine1962-C5)-methyltransferase